MKSDWKVSDWKVGEFVIAKHTIDGFYFVKGKEYYIRIYMLGAYEIIDEYSNSRTIAGKNMSMFFYTKKELRKEKLMKLDSRL
jgi:hypothetical protein